MNHLSDHSGEYGSSNICQLGAYKIMYNRHTYLLYIIGIPMTLLL